jgi:hypothetical protein
LKFIEILENRLDDIVDHYLPDLGRGDEGGAHTEGLGVGVGAAVHAAGDGGLAVVVVVGLTSLSISGR